jgi:hypothetical protein
VLAHAGKIESVAAHHDNYKMNLQIGIDTSTSLVLAILVIQLSIYLHISIQTNHPLSVPILTIIVALSVVFGALQVGINTCTTCDKCLAAHADEKFDDDEEYADEEEEAEADGEAEAEEEAEEEHDDVPELEEHHPETVGDKSLQQLRDFAAKIHELNLKNVCKYDDTGTVLNPEEIFEPRSSPKPLSTIPEPRTPEFPTAEPAVLESALVAELVQSETPI